MNTAKQTTARLGETGAIGGLGTAESHEQTSIKARPDAFELELIEAFQLELGYVRAQVHALEMKISRYERAFDTMFREELERRVGSKILGQENAACGIGPLERLKYQAEKAVQQNRF